jgi:sulfur carrier protein
LDIPFRDQPSTGDSAVLYRPAQGVTSTARKESTMRLLINGEEKSFSSVADVAGLVAALGLDPRKVAIERNLEIVPRSTYAATPIADGDRIEIVVFVGGG